MRLVHTLLIGFLLIATGIVAQDLPVYQPVEEDQESPLPQMTRKARMERHEMLLSHGINVDPAALINFLKDGFNMEGLPEGLPHNPEMKSMVVNAAIEELGVKRDIAALPLLTSMVKGNMPEGASRIIHRDFENYPVSSMDRQIDLMEQVLALNSIVALGLIGDEGGIEPVLTAMRTRKPTSFITKGAIALGQMGSNEGIGPLVLLARDIEDEDSVVAFEALYVLTGRNYGYTENTSLARRRELVEMLNQWYEEEGGDFSVHRADVMRRLRVPLREEALDPESLRGLLRGTMVVADYDRRYYARRRLAEIARGRFDDLRAIVEDEMEDLDIRRAAMRWLAISNPDDAKKIIKRQRKDENPVIQQSAMVILRDLPKYEEEYKNLR